MCAWVHGGMRECDACVRAANGLDGISESALCVSRFAGTAGVVDVDNRKRRKGFGFVTLQSCVD